MDFSALIYAAIGGGLGSGLGSVLALTIHKVLKKPSDINEQTPSGLLGGLGGGLAVLGMLALPALYKNMTLPRIVPLDQNEIFDSAPIYKVIKEQNPEDFKALVASIDRAARNNNVSQDDLDKMRVVLFELMAEKRAKASANTLRALEEVVQSQTSVYKLKSPTICTLMANGEPFPSVVEFLTADEVKLEQDAMEKLFTNPPRSESFVVDLIRGESLMKSIASEALIETGIDNLRPEITGSVQNNLKHQKICDFSILYSSKKTELSDDDLLHAVAYEGSL